MIAVLRHNFGMKLISFLLALLVWGYTRARDPIEERRFTLELLVNLDPGKSLVSQIPDKPTEVALIRGTASRLTRLTNSNPRAILDARGLEPGEATIIRPRLEPNIRGLRTEFEGQFEIIVDIYSRANFQPEEVTDGNLPTGFFIEGRIGLPQDVLVEGAECLMNRVARVVYFLNLSELEGSTEVPVHFQAVDENNAALSNLVLTPESATIGISLRPSQASKLVPVVVDYQGTPAANYALTSLSTDPFLVEVSGPAEALAEVVNVHTAQLNLTGKTGSFEQSVALLDPVENVSLSVHQATVSVQIEQMSGTATFEGVLIELRGTDDALYTYSVNPERVNVTIRGGVDRIAEVTAGFIHPQVYMNGLGPGTHQVRITVNTPSQVTTDRVTPLMADVTIEPRAVAPPPEESPPEEISPPEETEPAETEPSSPPE